MPNDPVLAAAVQRATAAVAQTAASPRNDMSTAAVAEAKPELQANIAAAIAPVIANATNTEEHWWQKRTRWAVIVGVLFTVGAPWLVKLGIPIDAATKELAIGTLTTLGGLGAAWLSYRAGVATTPLGTPSVPKNPVSYRG